MSSGCEKKCCPHCTYLNDASRSRCSMCQRSLKKVQIQSVAEASAAATKRSVASSQTKEESETTASPSTTPSVATHFPSSSAEAIDDANRSPGQVVLGLFQTAAGKPVSVSEKSYAKAKSILMGSTGSSGRSGPEETTKPRVRPSFKSPAVREAATTKSSPTKSACVETVHPAKDSVAATDALSQPLDGGTVSLFQTASGKAIHVSEEALQKARMRMKDILSAPPRRENENGEVEEGGALHKGSERSQSESSHDGKDRCARTPISAESGLSEAKATSRSGDPALVARTHAPPSSSLPASTPGWFVSHKGAPLHRGFKTPRTVAAASSTTSLAAPTAASSATPSWNQSSQSLRLQEQESRSVRPRLEGPSRHGVPFLTVDPLLFQISQLRAPAQLPSFNDLCTFHFRHADCGLPLLQLMSIVPNAHAGSGSGHGDASCVVSADAWCAALRNLGADRKFCSPAWCSTMVFSSMFKLLRLQHLRPDKPLFCPEMVLLSVVQKYNKEFAGGERSAFRKICEGDVAVSSFLICYLSSVTTEAATPHSRVVTLSDGFYHIKVALDVPLSALLRSGALRVGQKLSLCGARLKLSGSSSPLECGDAVVLGINYNCVSAVKPETPLGLMFCEPPCCPVSAVHTEGGLVPALRGVVTRALPHFFIVFSQAPSGRRTKIVYNRSAFFSQFADPRERDYHDAVADAEATMTSNGSAMTDAWASPPSSSSRPSIQGRLPGENQSDIRRVTAVLLSSADGDALIQFWESVSIESLTEGGESALPDEGEEVMIFAVNPSKYGVSTAPFPDTKLFYAGKALRFVASGRRSTRRSSSGGPGRVNACNADVTIPYCEASLSRYAGVRAGFVADIRGILLGMTSSDIGDLYVVMLEDDHYCLVQNPKTPARDRIFHFPVSRIEHPAIFIRHATLICVEDQAIADDCGRVVTNEYTEIVQKRVTPDDGVSSRLQQKLLSSTKKYEARCAEILRCATTTCSSDALPGTAELESSPAACIATPQSSAAPLRSAQPSQYWGPFDSTPGSRTATTPAANSSSHTGKASLPYYLRTSPGEQGFSTSRSGVKLLPNPSDRSPSLVGAQGQGAPQLVYHSYGNITWISCAERVIYAEGDSAVTPASAHRSPTLVTPSICVHWRYDNTVDARMKATVLDPALVQKLFSAVLDSGDEALQLSAADEDNHPSFASQRASFAARRREEDADWPLWWHVLTRSSVVGESDAADSTSHADCFVWSRGEWRLLQDTVTKAFSKFPLFKFCTSNGVVTAIHVVTESCDVRRLF